MTFYFYDLETSGFRSRTARIMQFAGQRTEMDLKPIGKPDNLLIKMTADTLPDPDAVLVHGITPQKTQAEGVSEAEFIKYLTSQVFKSGTIFIGYNNIRFDDEFMRFMLWRNFTDAYQWQWKNDSSRWDLLDVVRMMRALRPEGIKWPFAPDGKPSNKLADLASVNKLDHSSVHDALSDVQAVIGLARLISTKQPKLFKYLLNLRDKNKVAALVEQGNPLVYTSGRYPSEFEKTTIAVMIAKHPDRNAALMYDLRIDPTPFLTMSPQELAAAWQNWNKDAPYFPVKILSYNRSPAIAPLSVLDTSSAKRLKLDKTIINKNLQKLKTTKDFADRLVAALEIMQPQIQDGLLADEQKVDEQLYDGFVGSSDKSKMRLVQAADADKLADLQIDFSDQRLKLLLPLYKARNYPSILSQDQQSWWEEYRAKKLLSGDTTSQASLYFKRISELGARPDLSEQGKYLLEELHLYGQSIVPKT